MIRSDQNPLKKVLQARASRPEHVSGEWHNGAELEIQLYADSLQRAAKQLIQNLDQGEDAKSTWDAAPIILLYRQALELALKALVGEGAIFLKTPTDHITLYKTHSLPWLAQIVCQIIEAVEWKTEFKCEAISSLTEFTALIAEFEAMDPVPCAIHWDKRGRRQVIPGRLRRSNVMRLIHKLDSLLTLLHSTADALASTKDVLQHRTGSGAKPSIQ